MNRYFYIGILGLFLFATCKSQQPKSTSRSAAGINTSRSNIKNNSVDTTKAQPKVEEKK